MNMQGYEFTSSPRPQIDGQGTHEFHFSSLDRQRAYENITAATTPQDAAIEQKREIIRDIYENALLQEEILKNFPTVYAGSGVDIEYPLTLGSRNIVMVDPGFIDTEMVTTLEERVRALIGNKPISRVNNSILFEFDFGSGDEPVTVTAAPQYYNPEPPIRSPFTSHIPEPIAESKRYVLPEQTGMILGFASHYEPIEQPDIDKLVPGGVILDASPYTVDLALTDYEYEMDWLGAPGEPPEETFHRQRAFAKEKYASMGLKATSLKDDMPPSFFIKQS